MELMGPSTGIMESQSRVCKDNGKWKDNLGIKDFRAATH